MVDHSFCTHNYKYAYVYSFKCLASQCLPVPLARVIHESSITKEHATIGFSACRSVQTKSHWLWL